MDVNNLLKGMECSCGKRHTCPIKYVYIEKDATRHLAQICKDFHRILLVADENTFCVAGEQTVAALAGKALKKVVFSGKEILVPNEDAIASVTEALDGADLIVGIGSGVIQDLCKYVSHFHNVPYLVVATAPSMDGYASNGAAMITGGMKVTYPAGLPLALVADTAVLANAPMEMLQAGYGDIIGKFSALNDWKLSHLINGEYFCQYIYDLTYAQIQQTLALAEGILKRDEAAVKTLMQALVIVGILMSFAGSSRPASGSEHHLSHFFEITGILDGTEYFPHGIDVAYSTVITAKIRQTLLQAPFPREIYRPDTAAYRKQMARVYKSAAEGCIALQEKAKNYTTDRHYKEKEAAIREILSQMPTSEEIEAMLSLVGLEMKTFYRFYGEEKIADAVLYAKDLKDRFTVLWLNYDFFGDVKSS